MKTLILLCILFYILPLNAAIVRWDGEGGDGEWSNAVNWDHDLIPGITDDVILDNTYVSGDYTVYLPAGNTQISILSLTIQPDAFLIQCILPASNIASPALLLTREGDALILHSGAIFRNISGASSGTPVTVSAMGFVRINNGGRYVHQTARGHTDFLVSRLSVSPGTEEGIFEFDVPGTAAYTVSVSGRVFGKLVFSAATAGGIRTYTGAGINPVQVRGGLEIKSNAIFSYGANTDTITVEKGCAISAGGVFNIANGNNNSVVLLKGDLINNGTITETGTSTASAIAFGGTVSQTITNTGLISQQVRFVIRNPLGVTLLTPLHLSEGLVFIEGKIHTTMANILSFGSAAFCTGASGSGFVEGPVKKAGSDAFTFPTGTAGFYAPITIGDGGADTDEFVAEYMRANPQSTPGLGGNCVYPIHHISYVEYWKLNRVAGSSSRRVSLTVSPYSFAHDLGSLVVARADNGQWVSEGGTDHLPIPAAAPYVAGNFTSIEDVQSFGAFTIGSLINQAQNPLPLMLDYFDAVNGNGKVTLRWKTGICPAVGIRSRLTHTDRQGNRSVLWITAGNDATCHHQYTHTSPEEQNTYLLELFDEQDHLLHAAVRLVTVHQSDVFAISDINVNGFSIICEARLPAGRTSLMIIDAAGSVIYTGTQYMSGQPQRVTIETTGLAKGVYWLVAVNGNHRVSKGFVR